MHTIHISQWKAHNNTHTTPVRSSGVTMCDTPLLAMISGPPSCWLDEYTARPSTCRGVRRDSDELGLLRFDKITNSELVHRHCMRTTTMHGERRKERVMNVAPFRHITFYEHLRR